MHGQPIKGWTVDSLLTVTLLPGGLVSVVSLLLLAILYPQLKKRENEIREEIREEVQNPNSQFNADVGQWCQQMQYPVNCIIELHQDQMTRQGTDFDYHL